MRQISEDSLPKILLVDDEKNVLKSLSIGLGRYAYEVRVAGSGPEALRWMDETPCDFVVSDIRMKPMDGYTLAEKIHADFPDTTIVLMSAYGFDDEPACVAAEFVRFKLTKPFPVSELVDIVRQVTRAKGNALVFGESDTGPSFCRALEDAGYRSELIRTAGNPIDRTEWDRFDLFFVDTDYLDRNDWSALNTIDRHAGHRPVFLLSNGRGTRDVLATPGVSVTVLDKERFIGDGAWVQDVLREATERAA